MYATITQRQRTTRRITYQAVKRFVDLALCLLASPLILPVTLLCAIAIRLDSPGPALFVQDRIGKGGHRFRMFKFRTMRHGLDTATHEAYMRAYVRGSVLQEGQTFKPNHASQVTRVGRFLRKTSLDELPQLINVVKGEMSLVGPRPNVPWEVEEYSPWHIERLETLPGITGLAQVKGRSSIDFATLVREDIHYIERQSWTLDLKILWWTFSAVLAGQGAG